MGFPAGSAVKNPSARGEMQVGFLRPEGPLEKEMATHSTVLAWEISWTEKPGGLLSMGVTRAGHDLVTKPQQLVAFGISILQMRK